MPVPALADVQTRVADIEGRIAALRGDSTNGASNGSDFASVLGSALQGTDSGSPLDAISRTQDSGSSRGQSVVDIAKQWLGTPYVWGGNTPGAGLDCSGLVQQAFKQAGISMPRLASDQARMGTKVNSLAEAKPGDLVAFGSPVDHIGIYAGDNKMVVAPKKGDVVKVQEVYKTPTAIRRIIPDTPATAALNFAHSLNGTPSTTSANLNSALSALTSKSNGSNAISSTAIGSKLHSQFDNLFVKAGAKYNISPNLLAAVAKTESNFNPSARSGVGAQGLMQIMPATARSLQVNALDPAQAVDGAAKMLSGLISKFGSVDLALAGYNAGPGAVQKYGGIPPYKETQNYVTKITGLMKG